MSCRSRFCFPVLSFSAYSFVFFLLCIFSCFFLVLHILLFSSCFAYSFVFFLFWIFFVWISDFPYIWVFYHRLWLYKMSGSSVQILRGGEKVREDRYERRSSKKGLRQLRHISKYSIYWIYSVQKHLSKYSMYWIYSVQKPHRSIMLSRCITVQAREIYDTFIMRELLSNSGLYSKVRELHWYQSSLES